MKSILMLIILILTSAINAQYVVECGMTPNVQNNYPSVYLNNPPQIGGYQAPAKTLNGSNMKILCIFAQFQNDNKDINDSIWPKDTLPKWYNTFIGTDPNQAPFYANTISNYFF